MNTQSRTTLHCGIVLALDGIRVRINPFADSGPGTLRYNYIGPSGTQIPNEIDGPHPDRMFTSFKV